MSRIFHPYVGDSLNSKGVTHWIEEADEHTVGGRVYVKVGTLLMDQRDDWHETKSAAMDEAAVRIEAIACRLQAQAAQIRRDAEAIRAKQAEDDERYDRGLPPRIEVPQ